MAKNRSTGLPAEAGAVDNTEAPVLDFGEPNSGGVPSADAPTSAEVDQVLPDNTPTMTADRAFAGRRDHATTAFLVEERLSRKAAGLGIRKLTRVEWNAALEQFKSAPRV